MRKWYHWDKLSDYQDHHLTLIVPTWAVRGIASVALALQGSVARSPRSSLVLSVWSCTADRP